MTENWKQDKSYASGELVRHSGKVYCKSDDGDQSPPDSVPGGWVEVDPAHSNLAEFEAIANSFASYEARVQAHQSKMTAAKQSAMGKLAALGLTADEINALGLATT